jgi:hypothetical protein
MHKYYCHFELRVFQVTYFLSNLTKIIIIIIIIEENSYKKKKTFGGDNNYIFLIFICMYKENLIKEGGFSPANNKNMGDRGRVKGML